MRNPLWDHTGNVDMILYFKCGHDRRIPIKIGTGMVKTLPRLGSFHFCVEHEGGERNPKMQQIVRLVMVPSVNT
jgi:hypothetical protein